MALRGQLLLPGSGGRKGEAGVGQEGTHGEASQQLG